MNTLKLAIAACGLFVLSSFTWTSSVFRTVDKLEGNDSQIQFRIQLAAYDSQIPADDASKLFSMEGLSSMKSKGKTVYLTAPFSSEDEASKKLPEYRQMGFKRAVKVVIIEDYVVTSRVYHLMYDNRKAPASEKYKLFTPEIRVID
jgi:hypothetical protein